MTRRRSFWAWGWEDRFPAEAALKVLAQRLEMTLGLKGLSPAAPPRAEAIALSPPGLEIPESLTEVLSADHHERLSHTRGKSFPDLLRGFRGEFETAPDLVALPRDEADIAAVMAFAASEGAALIPYGGGSSVVGGVEAQLQRPRPVISLDLRHLREVLEVDPISRLARVQAGALGPDLEAQLGASGMTLRHFPQSFEFSTVGGWIATRAGGHFATVYTHIDDLVAGTRTLTPAGPIVTRPLRGSGAGPPPHRLVLGSEGALGVITEAWLRVRPRPTRRASATVHFKDWEVAVDATRAIAQSGLFPSNCRLIDRREAALNMVGRGDAHLLLLAFESAGPEVAPRLEAALAMALSAGGECPKGVRQRDSDRVSDGPEAAGGDTAEAWKSAFFEAPYLFSGLVSLGAVVDTFETACTWASFPRLHAGVIEAVRGTFRDFGTRGLVTCRFTHVYPDGPAPYFTFITAPRTPDEALPLWTAVKTAASEVLCRYGATITHHHAVGRLHVPWYARQVAPLFREALGAVKGRLDPDGIMNPGVLGLGE